MQKIGQNPRFGSRNRFSQQFTHENLHSLINTKQHISTENLTRKIPQSRQAHRKVRFTQTEQEFDSDESLSAVQNGKIDECLQTTLIEQFTKIAKNNNCKSFSVQAETILYKMEDQGKALASKPPHQFQTVLAASILWKIVQSGTQDIIHTSKKVLHPIADFLFAAIFKEYKGVQSEETLPINLFQNLKPWFISEKNITIEREAKEGSDRHLLEPNSEDTNITKVLETFFDKNLMRKVLKKFQYEAQRGKLGDVQIQRDFIENKQRQEHRRQDQLKYFNQWLLFVAQQKHIREKITSEQLQKKESDMVQRNDVLLERLDKAKVEIAELKVQLKKKEEHIAKQSKEIKVLKAEINLHLPKIISKTLDTFTNLFSSVPFVQRIEDFNPNQFSQLGNVWNNPKVKYILDPMSLDAAQKEQNTKKLSLRRLDTDTMKKKRWYLKNLLRPFEQLAGGGPGCQLLLGCSMDDIIFRWSFMMIEKTLNKLRPVLELLEDMLVLKKVKKTQTRFDYLIGKAKAPVLPTVYEKRNSPTSSDIDDEQQDVVFDKDIIYRLPNQYLREHINEVKPYLETAKESCELDCNKAQELYENLKKFYCYLRGPYLDYREGKSMSINLPEHLLAIIFDIDEAYKIVVLNMNPEEKVVWSEFTPITKNKVSLIFERMFKEQQTSRIPSQDRPNVYQIPDLTMIEDFNRMNTEHEKKSQLYEQVIDDKPSPSKQQRRQSTKSPPMKHIAQQKQMQNIGNYRKGIQSLKDIGQGEHTLQKYIFIKKTIERVTKVNLSSFVSTWELMGTEQTVSVDGNRLKLVQQPALSHLLSFLIMFRSKLDTPSQPISIKMDFNKKENDLETELLTEEQSISDELFENLLCMIFQTVHPMILCTVNSNIQDVTMLFPDSKIQDIVEKPIDEIKLRWINYVLSRGYISLKDREIQAQFQVDLQTGIGERFAKPKSYSQELTYMMNQNKLKKGKGSKNVQQDTKKKFIEDLLNFKQVKDQQSLVNFSYNNLIVLLATLSPDAVWQFFRMEYLPIEHGIDMQMLVVALLEPEKSACALLLKQKFRQLRQKQAPSSSEIGLFSENSQASSSFKGLKFEFRCLFVIHAVQRITQKDYLVSFDTLIHQKWTKQSVKEMVTELFLARPGLNIYTVAQGSNTFHDSIKTVKDFMYLQHEFLKVTDDTKKVKNLPKFLIKMNDKKEQVIKALQYFREAERVFIQICSKMKDNRAENLGSLSLLAQKHGLIRSNAFFCRLEKSLASLDYELLFHLMHFYSMNHAKQWCEKINEMNQPFKFPLRRFATFLSDDQCMVSYKAIWQMFKHCNFKNLNLLNQRDFHLKSSKIEILLIKTAKFVQNRRNTVYEYDAAKESFVEKSNSLIKLEKITESVRSMTTSPPKQRSQGLQSQSVKLLDQESASPSPQSSVNVIEEAVLKRVAEKVGMKNQAVQIRGAHLPKSGKLQEILLGRRFMYDMRLTVQEALAVLVALIYEVQATDILEFFMGGASTGAPLPAKATAGPDQNPNNLLLLQPDKANAKPKDPDLLNQYNMQQFVLEQTTNQSLELHKSQLSYLTTQERGARLIENIRSSVIGEEGKCCPQTFAALINIKCLFTASQVGQSNTRHRIEQMRSTPIETVLNFYKPFLIGLFEYYLYESYSNDQVIFLQESCLPLSAIQDFYENFASGESSRLNKTTFNDMIARIFEQRETISVKKQKEMTIMPKGFITFFDFKEIIFDISQEINVSQQGTMGQKLKDYIEKVIMLGVKYRLGASRHGKNSDNLHRKRLMDELDKVRLNTHLRKVVQKDI